MARRGYPPEFRRRVIDLVEGGRKVAEVAVELEVSEQTIYTWRRQARIDAGLEAGVATSELAELTAAKQRIRELETELAIHRRATELLKEKTGPKGRTRRSIAAEGLPVEVACRVLGVSVSGYYEWLNRAPSARALRHAWLTELIIRVHSESRGIYGVRRVHAELTLGLGLSVGRQAVELLMRRASLQGLSGRPRYRRVPNVATADDRVQRQFDRKGRDQLWVTDITEHPTREGKVYCAVVLDTFSRRVVGWSIDGHQTAALVTNALGMAIDQRRPADGATVIHSDQGTQFTSWTFTQIESFWSRMQVELLDRQRWKTRVELANAIFEYLEIFHNRRRRHSSLGMASPIEYELRHAS